MNNAAGEARPLLVLLRAGHKKKKSRTMEPKTVPTPPRI